MNIWLALLEFTLGLILGILTGMQLMWWRMNREWKRNPYRIKTIVDGVIAQREAREKEGKA